MEASSYPIITACYSLHMAHLPRAVLSISNGFLSLPKFIALLPSSLLCRRDWWPDFSCTPLMQLLEEGWALAPCPRHQQHLHVGVASQVSWVDTMQDGWPSWKCKIFNHYSSWYIWVLRSLNESASCTTYWWIKTDIYNKIIFIGEKPRMASASYI